jgi:hypothetical protein
MTRLSDASKTGSGVMMTEDLNRHVEGEKKALPTHGILLERRDKIVRLPPKPSE